MIWLLFTLFAVAGGIVYNADVVHHGQILQVISPKFYLGDPGYRYPDGVLINRSYDRQLIHAGDILEQKDLSWPTGSGRVDTDPIFFRECIAICVTYLEVEGRKPGDHLTGLGDTTVSGRGQSDRGQPQVQTAKDQTASNNAEKEDSDDWGEP